MSTLTKQKNTKRWTLVNAVEKYARKHTNISISYYHSRVTYYANGITVELFAADGWVFARLNRKGRIVDFEDYEHDWKGITLEQHRTYQRFLFL